MAKSKKAWRFGDEELIYIKEVLDSGFGASTSGNMNQRLEHAVRRPLRGQVRHHPLQRHGHDALVPGGRRRGCGR